MTEDPADRPTGEDAAVPPKAEPKVQAPKKGFDPANIKGGKHPGGKVMRGTRMMQSAKSRGRG